MTANPPKDWKQLAKRAATEQDPAKLLEIVNELNSVLLEREWKSHSRNRPIQLLLVDDEKGIGLTLLPVLQEHGFEAQVAATVEEALEAIRVQKFDGLICDLNISREGDGFDVVKQMRKTHPRSVIIVLTGYPAFESAIEGIRLDIDDYIVKPADYDVLITTLNRKLADHRTP